jgi:hypothetical protein
MVAGEAMVAVWVKGRRKRVRKDMDERERKRMRIAKILKRRNRKVAVVGRVYVSRSRGLGELGSCGGVGVDKGRGRVDCDRWRRIATCSAGGCGKACLDGWEW